MHAIARSCKFSYNKFVAIKYLTRRDSHKYFMDFDQLLHDYSGAPKNNLCESLLVSLIPRTQCCLFTRTIYLWTTIL